MATIIQPELVTGWCDHHAKQLQRYDIKAYEYYIFGCEVKKQQWELGEIPNQKYFRPVLTKCLADRLTGTPLFIVTFVVHKKMLVTQRVYNLCNAIGESYLQGYNQMIEEIKQEIKQNSESVDFPPKSKVQ